VALLGQDPSAQLLCKKHISGVGMPLIPIAKIIKKLYFLAHLVLFFDEIFSVCAISCSLVINIKFWQLK